MDKFDNLETKKRKLQEQNNLCIGYGVYDENKCFWIDTKATVDEMPKISVVGVGTVTAFPNSAQITIALNFKKPTLREAVNENQKTASEVLAIASFP